MTHVFVAPHPDDIALSCGGLVASLRELGQAVTIISVFSGGAGGDYRRTTLGFGNKAVWPLTEAFRRDNIAADYEVKPSVRTGRPPWMADPGRLDLTQERANTQSRQFWQRAAWTRSANVTAVATAARPIADTVGGQATSEPIDWEKADEWQLRKAEEERFAYLMETSVVFLDLPPAQSRGYAGDDQLLGPVREDDVTPDQLLYQEIVRLEPQTVFFPLAVGNHVDHQIVRDVGLNLLGQRRRWVMPGPNFVGTLSFYEDFPYAWWNDYEGPLAGGRIDLDLPPGVGVEAHYADITEMIDRKGAGINLYAGEVQRLFESKQAMIDDLYGYHARMALAGRVAGYAERYWATTEL
jgi:LmbE family N-acetylglucosaminyl deacetylase